jgi:hypothetical protein
VTTKSGNGKDRAKALVELRERLTKLRPKDRLDALLDPKDAKSVVRSLPVEELYPLILDVGLADSTEIVQLASPRQFQSFVDLGAWEGDRLDPHRMLRAFVVVHDLEEDPDVNPQGVTMESPEGKYLLEFLAEGPELAALRELMRDLYYQGPLETARLLEAIRWELPSELEEAAHHFRNARLGDMGFPPAEEAAAVFAYVDPEKVSKVSAPSTVAQDKPVPAATEKPNYITAMLDGFSGDDREKLESEIRYLMSSVLVVEGASPGDANAVRDMAAIAHDTLSLGLEHLTGANPALASQVADTHPLKRVFQVGFSLTLKLKHHADRLVREPGVRELNVLLMLSDERAQISALRRKRPRRWLKVEGAEPVAFRSRRELQDAAAGLARAAQQVLVFRTFLGVTREAVGAALAPFGGDLEKLTPDRFFAALVAHAVLDGEVSMTPVPESRLVELGERLFEGEPTAPKLRRSAKERATTALAKQVPAQALDEAGRMVERTLERFANEWATAFLKDERLDPVMVTLHLPLSPK